MLGDWSGVVAVVVVCGRHDGLEEMSATSAVAVEGSDSLLVSVVDGAAARGTPAGTARNP